MKPQHRSMRVYTDESVSAKIFIEFVSLIERSYNEVVAFLKEGMMEE